MSSINSRHIRFVEVLMPGGTPVDLMSRVRFRRISNMVRDERVVMRFCRVRMVPFVGERCHGGCNDREDNNEIHGNLTPRRGVVRGRRGCTRSYRGDESFDSPKNRAT